MSICQQFLRISLNMAVSDTVKFTVLKKHSETTLLRQKCKVVFPPNGLNSETFLALPWMLKYGFF